MDESQIKEEIERASATQLPPEDIAKWMRHDTWTRTDAMLILMGIDPDRTAIIERKTEYGKPEWAFDQDGPWLMGQDDCAPTRSEIRRLEESLTERMRAWDSGGHPSGCSPEYFIKWSVDHGFAVRWLEAARDVGLIGENFSAAHCAAPSNAALVEPMALAANKAKRAPPDAFRKALESLLTAIESKANATNDPFDRRNMPGTYANLHAIAKTQSGFPTNTLATFRQYVKGAAICSFRKRAISTDWYEKLLKQDTT
jgi:hypothetical protein